MVPVASPLAAGVPDLFLILTVAALVAYILLDSVRIEILARPVDP